MNYLHTNSFKQGILLFCWLFNSKIFECYKEDALHFTYYVCFGDTISLLFNFLKKMYTSFLNMQKHILNAKKFSTVVKFAYRFALGVVRISLHAPKNSNPSCTSFFRMPISLPTDWSICVTAPQRVRPTSYASPRTSNSYKDNWRTPVSVRFYFLSNLKWWWHSRVPSSPPQTTYRSPQNRFDLNSSLINQLHVCFPYLRRL